MADRFLPAEFRVTGLRNPVELRVDYWGVPHLYARDEDDLFLAQGFNAARDRLFQIDLWRRRGLGLLSEAFGARHLEQDAATRTFLYRGDMRVEWDSYGPHAQRTAERFTSGVNAYLDWLDEHPEAMPEEFHWLGHRPARWAPEDVVRIRTNSIVGNATSEVPRSRVTCVAGTEASEIGLVPQPEWETTVPDGFDPCSLPPEVLRTLSLARAAISFAEEDGRIVARPTDPVPGHFGGSNNWVIGGSRTESGRPILANDPHREYAAPSLRYVAHLCAPELNVLGAGEPAVPGISIGHNGRIAFGLTVFPVDQEDLYVYELDPDDHARYRYGAGWERMRVVTEHVPVSGQDPAQIEIRFTRHGPVLAVDAENHRAYALRASWLEPGSAPYFGSLRLLRATNVEEFTAAMRGWFAPPENLVYADVDGNIAWIPGALIPRRVSHDGLFPVPGDGRYEWRGWYDSRDLPSRYNPPEGFIATANQLNLPPDFPYEEKKIGFEWGNPYRYQRIREVLSSPGEHSVQGSAVLQSDWLSIPSRRILTVLRSLPQSGDAADAALNLLRDWDAVESLDSGPAALFLVWRTRHLEPTLLRMIAPTAAELIQRPDTIVVLEALEHPELWFGEAPEATRDALLRNTLATAHAEVIRLLGADPRGWRWGDLLHVVFEHPLSQVLDDDQRRRVNVGPFPRGGSDHTLNVAGIDPFTFRQLAGASFRMVLDVGAWDRSLAVNTPGQSGDPHSPHYRDLATLWQHGEHFPLCYSRAAVEEHTERTVWLIPRNDAEPTGQPP